MPLSPRRCCLELRYVLTEDEKESLLATSKLYNEEFRNKTIGENSIALTRNEYDEVQKLAGFPHRFQTE